MIVSWLISPNAKLSFLQGSRSSLGHPLGTPGSCRVEIPRSIAAVVVFSSEGNKDGLPITENPPSTPNSGVRSCNTTSESSITIFSASRLPGASFFKLTEIRVWLERTVVLPRAPTQPASSRWSSVALGPPEAGPGDLIGIGAGLLRETQRRSGPGQILRLSSGP